MEDGIRDGVEAHLGRLTDFDVVMILFRNFGCKVQAGRIKDLGDCTPRVDLVAGTLVGQRHSSKEEAA